MKILKKLFKWKSLIYRYDIVEYDSDGDAFAYIMGDDLVYIVDLDWEDGIMDIEFGVKGCGIHDTTNHNVQYKLLNTISHITRKIAKKCGMQFHTVVFKSSNWRNGKEDSGSSDIRNRFFSRYVIKEYPNAIVRNGENNSIIINLNDE
jgi:hypothetical protein